MSHPLPFKISEQCLNNRELKRTSQSPPAPFFPVKKMFYLICRGKQIISLITDTREAQKNS